MRRSLGFGPAAPAAGPAESLAAHPPNPFSTSRTLLPTSASGITATGAPRL